MRWFILLLSSSLNIINKWSGGVRRLIDHPGEPFLCVRECNFLSCVVLGSNSVEKFYIYALKLTCYYTHLVYVEAQCGLHVKTTIIVTHYTLPISQCNLMKYWFNNLQSWDCCEFVRPLHRKRYCKMSLNLPFLWWSLVLKHRRIYITNQTLACW